MSLFFVYRYSRLISNIFNLLDINLDFNLKNSLHCDAFCMGITYQFFSKAKDTLLGIEADT